MMMDDEHEDDKDTAVSEESLDDVFEAEVDDEEEADSDLTDEFGNPKEEEKGWE
jgi:hypothetical protein